MNYDVIKDGRSGISKSGKAKTLPAALLPTALVYTTRQMKIILGASLSDVKMVWRIFSANFCDQYCTCMHGT